MAVDFPLGQTCCAQPAFNAGFHEQARRVAQRNLLLFADHDYVVVPSGSCTAMIRLFYADLFADDPDLRRQAESLAARTYELSEFLFSVVGIDDVGAAFPGKVAYHASCHLQRELGVTQAPRRLIGGGVRNRGLRRRDVGAVLRLRRHVRSEVSGDFQRHA